MMKTPKLLLMLIGLLFPSLANGAGTYVTLSFIRRSASDPDIVKLQVASNQVAKLISAKLYKVPEQQILRITRIGSGGADIAAYKADDIATLGGTNGILNPLVIRGPVEISYEANGQYNGFATFEIINTEEVISVSTAIVVPSDASGPVQVSLESSPDLVNWTEAQPGTYGTSTQKRFFRVRAKIISP